MFTTTPSLLMLAFAALAAAFLIFFLSVSAWGISQSAWTGFIMFGGGLAIGVLNSMRFPRRYTLRGNHLEIRFIWTTWQIPVESITAVEQPRWWKAFFFRGAVLGAFSGAILLRTRAPAPWYLFAQAPDVLMDCRRPKEFITKLESFRAVALATQMPAPETAHVPKSWAVSLPMRTTPKLLTGRTVLTSASTLWAFVLTSYATMISPLMLPVFGAFFAVGVLLLIFSFPRSIEVRRDALAIKLLLGRVVVPIETISNVREARFGYIASYGYGGWPARTFIVENSGPRPLLLRTFFQHPDLVLSVRDHDDFVAALNRAQALQAEGATDGT